MTTSNDPLVNRAELAASRVRRLTEAISNAVEDEIAALKAECERLREEVTTAPPQSAQEWAGNMWCDDELTEAMMQYERAVESDQAIAATERITARLAALLTEYAEQRTAKMRGALERCIELLQLCDCDGDRAKNIRAPEDDAVRPLCEGVGYGAIMDSAQRQWFLKDNDGCHTCGPCAASVRFALKKARAALKESEE